MIKSKLLSDSAWKDFLAKNKAVKDNGMLKVLADVKKLGDDDHDDAQKILDEVLKLTAQLKKSKEVASAPAVGKYLAELASAAEASQREVTKARAEAEKARAAKGEAEKKAKAEADKKAKAEADARKDAEDDKSRKGDDEHEDDESAALLTTKLVPLLRQVAKGDAMHALVASSGKDVVVMLARKPIAPARRKLLAEELGASGGVKYFTGHCLLEEGMTTFALKTQVAGLAKKIKLALLAQTGLRVKVRCRGEDGDTDEDADERGDTQGDASGDGDERAEHRLGDRSDDDEGKASDDTKDDDDGKGDDEDGDQTPRFVPGVDIEPAGSELSKAPAMWDDTREGLQASIDELRRAVTAQVAGESPDLVDEVTGNLAQLDRVLGKLDRRLSDALSAAGSARDPGQREASIRKSKAILAEYIRYVGSEPLIAHMDRNPFGVKTDMKVTLARSLRDLARALG